MSGVNSHAILQRVTTSRALAHSMPTKIKKYFDIPKPIMRVTDAQITLQMSSESNPGLIWLQQHVVDSKSILPGTALLRIAHLSVIGVSNHTERHAQSSIIWFKPCPVDLLPSLLIKISMDGTVVIGLPDLTSAFKARLDASSESELQSTRVGIKEHSTTQAIRFYRETYHEPGLGCYFATLSQMHFPGDDRLPLIAYMDSILHLTAIEANQKYLPVGLECCFLNNATDSRINTAVASVPEYDAVRESMVESFSASNIVENQVSFKRLQGRSVQSPSAAHERDPAYLFQQLATKPTPHLIDKRQSSNAIKIGNVKQIYSLKTNDEHSCVYSTALSFFQTSRGLQDVSLSTTSQALPHPSGLRAKHDADVTLALMRAMQLEQCPPKSNVLRCSYLQSQRWVGECMSDVHAEASVEYIEETTACTIARDGLSKEFYDKSIAISGGFHARHHKTKSVQQPGQLSVSVASVGLNFRDLLLAMGLYPSSHAMTDIGSDFSGYILSSSDGKFKKGDAVFGQCRGALERAIHVAPETVTHVPHNLTMEDAAGLPTVLLTAINCAKCMTEETKTVLIHAASGGFGLALAEVAQASGIRVVTTAGSPFKRTYLRSKLIHSYNSRDYNFVNELVARESVQMVVNTLTSPGMVAASTAALAAGGCFVEVSKRDIYSHQRTLQERPDIKHYIVAVDLMQSQALREDFGSMASLLASAAIKPIGGTYFPFKSIQTALSRFKSGANVGKIICIRQDQSSERGSAWIVTGGAGALGALSADVLASKGYGILIPARRKILSRCLCDLGVESRLDFCDVSDREALQTLMRNGTHGKHVAGIVHSSGLLQDALLINQSPKISRPVFAAKVIPFKVIEECTSSYNIDTIVSYSSVSSIWGNIGQANYSAANRILDSAANSSVHRVRSFSCNFAVILKKSPHFKIHMLRRESLMS